MGRLRVGTTFSVLSALTVAMTAGCAGDGPGSPAADDGSGEANTAATLTDDAVTVGSFDFAESVLLAEVYSQAIEHHGVDVERAFALGPREFVAPAVAVGLVELIPEYAGSAATFLSRGEDVPPNDPAATHELLVDGLRPHPVTALAEAPAQNANAFVVMAATARRYGLETLSDVAAVADELVFGGPPECSQRALCLVGLEDVYGIRFETVVSLDAGGPLTQQALRDGGIDIGLLFSSGSEMAGGDFVELRDDRGLQPAENVTPILRTEVVDRWGPALVEAVDAVSAELTTEELRRLNAEFDDAGGDPAPIASAWLDRVGLT